MAVVVVVVVAARGRQAAWSKAARAWQHRRSCGESSGARGWVSQSARSIPRYHGDLGRRARGRALDVVRIGGDVPVQVSTCRVVVGVMAKFFVVVTVLLQRANAPT